MKKNNARSKRVANKKKAANRQKSESTVRDTDKVYVSDKTAEEQLESVRAKENKKFNYSEYMSAPAKSVKYLDKNKFGIVVGAGGDYHYDDVWDNAAIDVLNNTTFVVEEFDENDGLYVVKEAFGMKIKKNASDSKRLDDIYRGLYKSLEVSFVGYIYWGYDYTPSNFTRWVRSVIHPKSIAS